MLFLVLPVAAANPTPASPIPALQFGDTTRPPFGWVHGLVLVAYFLVVVLIGWRCARRESSTDAYFLGGGRIPWWAAGLSVFSTLLSAITYLAIPARAYATDWTLLPVNLCVLVVAPVIAFKYLPVLRRQRITTVFEFLAVRFGPWMQRFGSASFIAFQLGRMGVVLLLPALALSAITGIHLVLCIVLMGVLSTLYTVLGGIEAVVWTDVVQAIVLLGGAVSALVTICAGLENGVGDLFRVGAGAGKFHWVNLQPSLVRDSLIVVLLGGLFSNALVPYSADQSVIQRYLTTPDIASARRSLWLGAILVLPATVLFLLLGTGLFVFFEQHPGTLATLRSPEQILPWFVASQMPGWLGGLVIAGVFAAAMSSLDSSMHSVATSLITDWWQPLGEPREERVWVQRARGVTLAAGLFGTLTALVLAGWEIHFLWDFFLGMIGLIGGTLAGVMAVAVFLPSAGARHVWPGVAVSLAALICVKFLTPINSLLLGFVGVAGVVLGTLVSQRCCRIPV